MQIRVTKSAREKPNDVLSVFGAKEMSKFIVFQDDFGRNQFMYLGFLLALKNGGGRMLL